MNRLEKKMLDALKDLRENHHCIGIKAEFEAEGTRMEEALRLKEVITRAGLDLSIKIGGCEALKDMFEARTIGVNAIIAPMVESPYALKKYIHSAKLAFPAEEREDVAFLINIETITGFNNFADMLAIPEAAELTGIVLGRVDMTGSMGLSREEINSPQILNIAQVLAKQTQAANKKLIIGGGVSSDSLPFFRSLPEGVLYKYETRKIIFDAQAGLASANPEAGLVKAVGFELMWLKNKRDYYGLIFEEDANRIVMLEKRYAALLDKYGAYHGV
ncbi:MAG: aldolase/citrate lyase family protein [Vampirovibrionales bacterium]